MPPIVVPRELVDALDAWEEDRAACAAAEDSINGPAPWWEDSDDAGIALLGLFSNLIAEARRSR